MKILPQLTLTLAIATLAIGTLSVVRSANAEQPREKPVKVVRISTPKPNALAEPLLHRVFTSGCSQDKTGFYRESLEFFADGTARFSRRFFADAQCKDASTGESVREGHYALMPDENGQMLLTVRHLHGQKAEDSLPYFEALIKIEQDQLEMENGPSSTQRYLASSTPI